MAGQERKKSGEGIKGDWGGGGQKGKLSKEKHRAMLAGGGEGEEGGLEGGLRGGWDVRGRGNAVPSNTPV